MTNSAPVRKRQEAHHRFDQSRIAMMQGYAELSDCRRSFILNYFGEETDGPCGFCDNCDAGIVSDAPATEEPFAANTRVRHTEWGDGTVMRYEGDKNYRSL